MTETPVPDAAVQIEAGASVRPPIPQRTIKTTIRSNAMDYLEQIAEAMAAAAQRAAQNRIDAHELEVLANATTSRCEARAFRAEAKEARDQADTLSAMAARHRR